MGKKLPQYPSLKERIELRSKEAQQTLQKKNFLERIWGNIHVEAANIADTFHSFLGNEYANAVAGFVIGGIKGAMLGIIAGVAIANIAVLGGLAAMIGVAAGPAAIIAYGIIGTVVGAVKGTVDYFIDAKNEAGDKVGKAVADRIMAKGHACSKAKSPELAKAIVYAHNRLNNRIDSDKIVTPGVEEKKPHKFTDILKAEKVTVAEKNGHKGRSR